MMSRRSEHYVTIRLEFGQLYEPEALEDFALAALDAVDSYAGNVAIGPVVSGDFEPSAIEVSFRVLATTLTDLQGATSQVIRAIERIQEEDTDLQSLTGSWIEQEPLTPTPTSASRRGLVEA